MTAKELIEALQTLGEENLDRKVIMLDGISVYTPFQVKLLVEQAWGNQKGNILID